MCLNEVSSASASSSSLLLYVHYVEPSPHLIYLLIYFQRDTMGSFLERFGSKFSSKNGPNVWQLFRLPFGKIGRLLIPASVHTAYSDRLGSFVRNIYSHKIKMCWPFVKREKQTIRLPLFEDNYAWSFSIHKISVTL